MLFKILSLLCISIEKNQKNDTSGGPGCRSTREEVVELPFRIRPGPAQAVVGPGFLRSIHPFFDYCIDYWIDHLLNLRIFIVFKWQFGGYCRFPHRRGFMVFLLLGHLIVTCIILQAQYYEAMLWNQLGTRKAQWLSCFFYCQNAKLLLKNLSNHGCKNDNFSWPHPQWSETVHGWCKGNFWRNQSRYPKYFAVSYGFDIFPATSGSPGSGVVPGCCSIRPRACGQKWDTPCGLLVPSLTCRWSCRNLAELNWIWKPWQQPWIIWIGGITTGFI